MVHEAGPGWLRMMSAVGDVPGAVSARAKEMVDEMPKVASRRGYHWRRGARAWSYPGERRQKDAQVLKALGFASQVTGDAISATVLLQKLALPVEGHINDERIAKICDRIIALEEKLVEHETAILVLEKERQDFADWASRRDSMLKRIELLEGIFTFVDVDGDIMRRSGSSSTCRTASLPN